MWRRATTARCRERWKTDGLDVSSDDEAAEWERFVPALEPDEAVGEIGESRSNLEAAIASMRGYATGSFSAKRAVGPLLDLWDLASAVDRSAARPIEALLVAVVDRAVVAADELAACLDDVEHVLDRLSHEAVG